MEKKTLIDMFLHAEKHLKHPHIRYPFNNGFIDIRKAKNPKNPDNYLYIYYRNYYVGKITRDNVIHLTTNDQALHDAIKAIHTNSLEALACFGQKFSYCCFCGTEITNKNSLAVGYGPICAEKYGLPWDGMAEELERTKLTENL